ncbi:MAG: hypothetical protein RL030_244 [Pseudomonadota bacterium]
MREVLDSIEGVNGVPLHIERFSGRDVPELLRRWLAEWSADEQTAGQGSGRTGEWRLHARLLRPSFQEVLQVRGQGEAAELLWSRLPLSSDAADKQAVLRLPTHCKAGPRVHGRDDKGDFEVSSAVCGRSPDNRRLRTCVIEAAGEPLCVMPMPGAEGAGPSARVFVRRNAAGSHR